MEPTVTAPLTLVKISEFEFTRDFSYHRRLTCVNHQELRWFTKNPYERHLHFSPNIDDAGRFEVECDCRWEELRVIVEESQPPTN